MLVGLGAIQHLSQDPCLCCPGHDQVDLLRSKDFLQTKGDGMRWNLPRISSEHGGVLEAGRIRQWNDTAGEVRLAGGFIEPDMAIAPQPQ